MEVDFHRQLPPERFTVHTGRMRLEETTPEAETEMLDHHVLPAARDLGTARPDVVVFGCTSAGALRGNEADRELCERIAEVAGTEVVSTIRSVREAVDRREARRIGVITPYVDALNQRIQASLEADGVEVAGINGLGITENFAIARVPPGEIVRFARESLAGIEFDMVVASCTNFRAVDALDALERTLRVPVVSSNQAVLEALLLRHGLSWPPDRSPQMAATEG